MKPSAAGIVLVVVGILFLLRNFGFNLHIGQLLSTWWPLILIVVGVGMLFKDRSRS